MLNGCGVRRLSTQAQIYVIAPCRDSARNPGPRVGTFNFSRQRVGGAMGIGDGQRPDPTGPAVGIAPRRHDPAISGPSMLRGVRKKGLSGVLAAWSQTGHSPAQPGGAGADADPKTLKLGRLEFMMPGIRGEQRAVKNMPSFRCLTAVLAAGISAALSVQSLAAQTPSALDLSRNSPSGNYLAARSANIDRDAATASAYYQAALKADPKNTDLLELAFYAELAGGNIDEAVKLAERLLAIDPKNRNARLILGVRALKVKNYKEARTQFQQAGRDPITNLTATLLSAWSSFGANDTKGAVDAIDKLTGPDWFGIFKDMHAGLMLDIAGSKKEAGKRFERAYKLDQNALRIVQSYGSWVSRNGGKDDALKIFQDFDKALARHPLVLQALAELRRGEKVPQIVDSAQAGAAEVLYGLGAALGRREEELSLANRGLAYLQLAIYLDPGHPLALLSLADLYEAMKKPQLAIVAYERLPSESALKRNADIQMAIDLDSLEKTDDARKHLQQLIAARPDDVEAIMALGNIERERKQYAECVETYGRGAAAIPTPVRANWTLFYFRGICYERSKQWSKAEADLKKALELYPEQPHVLNYLGYSWVDQGLNLDEGMRMIKRSVEQRPDDGYIVDSLGWAWFRLGDYDEAVKQLERAVELKPVDPTINDHLGDAYWRVGRTLEAKFQWAHARDLKPEPDDLKKIEAKLQSGLAEAVPPSPSADAEKAKKPRDGG
jgi:tetratricopeptide (TPR) repeat protein